MAHDQRTPPSTDRASLTFEAGGDTGEWHELDEQREGGRRTWLLVGGLAALAGLLTVVVLSGGRTEKANGPASTATTASSAPPSTTASSAPPSSAPSSTLAISIRASGTGPVLGSPVGQHLVGVTKLAGEWFLVDVDLDTGDWVRVLVPGLTEPDQLGAGLIPVHGGALVFAQPGPAVIATDDGHVSHVGTDYPQTIYPGPDPSSAWWIDFRGNGAGPTLLQVRLSDSSVLASIPLVSNLQVIGPDGEGGVLLTMLGGPTWRVRPGGAIQTLTTVKGSVVAAGSGVIVEERCDDTFRCGLVAHAADQEAVVAVGISGTPVSSGAISPGGGRLALWTANPESSEVELTLVNLPTGTTRGLASDFSDHPPSNVVWVSPDILVFKQGVFLRFVHLDQPGAQPQPIVVNGEELALELYGVGPLAS